MDFLVFKRELKKAKYSIPIDVDDIFVYKFWLCYWAMENLNNKDQEKSEKNE